MDWCTRNFLHLRRFNRYRTCLGYVWPRGQSPRFSVCSHYLRFYLGINRDRLSTQVMFFIGSVGTVFSIMMTSLCNELYQFILAQGILLGISMTLILCPTVTVIGQHFKQHRAAAVGITISGSSLGGVIWPIIVHELFKKPNVGFGWTMRIVGFIMLPIFLVACLCVRPPREQKQHEKFVPPSTSQLSDIQLSPDKSVSHVETETKNPPRRFDLSPLKSPTIQLCCLGFFFVYFSMFTPIFFVTSYSSSLGLSSTFAFYTTSIVNGGSLFGRVLPGFIADKYGHFNCCILATLFSGIISLCWTKALSEAGVGVFIAAYGFSSGVSEATYPLSFLILTIICRQFFPYSRHAWHKSPHLPIWELLLEPSWRRHRSRKYRPCLRI